MKTIIGFTTVFLLSVFLSCKKTSVDNILPIINTSIPDQYPDYTTKVNANVSGFVTNENDIPVMGADVNYGSATMITDQYGYFEFKNVEVTKDAATVIVNYPTYFKTIKTYTVREGEDAFFRIKLLPRIIIGTINSSAGGSVSSQQGLQVSLPANAVKVAASGNAYTGTVTVSATWIDPTSNELHKIMPGELRGVNTGGVIKRLSTFGMVGVELTGSSGQTLQIADGKKATLHFPLPSTTLANAPATIPLWYLDVSTGLWKEEGIATKNGNAYEGEVAHFSFWNCDLPSSFINLSARILTSSGQPVARVLVRITQLSAGNSAADYTSFDGFVSGRVPDNADILLEVFAENGNCISPYYTQQIRTGSGDISLGNIVLPANIKIARVQGSAVDCNNNAVQQGYLQIKNGFNFTKYPLSSGMYDFSSLLCDDTETLTLFAVDLNTAKQSNVISTNITQGENTVAVLQTCALSTLQYFKYSLDGGLPVIMGDLNGSAGYEASINATRFSVGNIYGSAISNFALDGAPATGIHNTNNTIVSTFFTASAFAYTAPASFPVNITEYGAVGEYISGSYRSAIFTEDYTGQTVSHNLDVDFRVKRTY